VYTNPMKHPMYIRQILVTMLFLRRDIFRDVCSRFFRSQVLCCLFARTTHADAIPHVVLVNHQVSLLLGSFRVA